MSELTWTEAAGQKAPVWLAVPVGATEQHGPHLPLGTDTAVAVELAERLAAARGDVWVAPPLPYGASGEHAAFAGTLSIGHEALEFLLVELGRSADHFAGLILINAHGGNAQAVGRAARRLHQEGRPCLAWSPSPPPRTPRWDAHAGYVETSIALALECPGVHPERAQAGNSAPLGDLAPQLRTLGVAAVSANGVLGDPTGASAAEGRRLLQAFDDELFHVVGEWIAAQRPHPR